MTDQQNQKLATRNNGDDKLAQRAEYLATLKEMIINGSKLTDEQINGRLAFAMQQGLDPISEVHTLAKDGKTMSHTMSINGLRRKNDEALIAATGNTSQTIDLEFAPFAKENMQKDWLYAYECRLRDSVSYSQWQKRLLEIGKTLREIMGSMDYATLEKACGPAPVTVGVGVFYTSELSEYKDRNFNPIERCKKRAETNARHHRWPTNAPVYESDNNDAPGPEPAPQISVDKIEEPAPKKSEAQLLGELGFDAPLPAFKRAGPDGEPQQPDEEIQEGEYTEEQAPSLLEQAETIAKDPKPTEPPADVAKAMKIRFGHNILGESSLDELAAIIDNANLAESLRKQARLVLDWMTV